MKPTYAYPLAALISTSLLFALTGCDGGKSSEDSHEDHNHGAAVPGDHHEGHAQHDDHHSAKPNTQQPSDARKVTVEATDFAFNPATITAQPGEKLFIELVNKGSAVHMWEIEGVPGTHVHAPVGQTSREVVLAPTKRGSYRIICTTAGHEQLGMVGTLVVK